MQATSSIAFYAVFGVIQGYHHENVIIDTDNGLEIHSFNKSSVKVVSETWQKAMQEEFEKSNILISAVLSESNTVYPVGFGCPNGGEKTVTVNGHYNPNFEKASFTDYRRAVIRVCKVVKKALKQTTVSIAFYELGDFVYLTDKIKKV